MKEALNVDDTFVYSQEDLDKALAGGCRSIILSAGVFMVPRTENTVYKGLGPVTVIVSASEQSAAAAGMVFENIKPVFRAGYAITEKAARDPVAAFLSAGSYSSFGSFGSFGSGIYTYSHEYEFEFVRGSFAGSFAGSYSLGYSFRSSYLIGSGTGSFCGRYRLKADTAAPLPVRVFGYGIELI